MTALEQRFSKTVAEHKSTIYTVCYMFSQDADEVNDLFQEVLVNLWKGFESFEHRSDVRTWIYRVALNTCISIDRKKKRHSSEVRLTMDINLFEDRDEDTHQWLLVGIPFIFIWLGWFAYEIYVKSGFDEVTAFFWAGCVGAIIGGSLGYRIHTKTQHQYQDVIDQIEDLTNE